MPCAGNKSDWIVNEDAVRCVISNPVNKEHGCGRSRVPARISVLHHGTGRVLIAGYKAGWPARIVFCIAVQVMTPCIIQTLFFCNDFSCVRCPVLDTRSIMLPTGLGAGIRDFALRRWWWLGNMGNDGWILVLRCRLLRVAALRAALLHVPCV